MTRKGQISSAHDADMVLLSKDDLMIETVIAKGQIVVENKEVIVKGTFE